MRLNAPFRLDGLTALCLVKTDVPISMIFPLAKLAIRAGGQQQHHEGQSHFQ